MHTEYQQITGPAPPNAYAYAGATPERDPIFDFAMRWWWLLAIGVILGIVGAMAYARLGPVTYSSAVLIQVSANTGTDLTDNAGQARSATSNFAAEGESMRMYGLVSEELSGTLPITPTELLRMARSGSLDISQQRGTNFVSVEITDEDPVRAQQIANTFATVLVRDVNQRASDQATARIDQLQQQIDFTRQQLAVAQLFDRERQLTVDLREQQQRLLTLQATYQQERARQLEFDQLSNGQPLEASVAEARADFETIMIDQIANVEQNIISINDELNTIRTTISELPPETDPLISTAYASAYASQLTNLTSQMVEEQVATITAGPPLEQFGDASTPLKVQSLKKLAFFGIAAGGAIAAAVAFAVDLWRKRRPRPLSQDARAGVDIDLEALLRRLDKVGVSQRPTATGNEPAMRHSHRDPVRDPSLATTQGDD